MSHTYYITGITGFLGRHIVKELVKKDSNAHIVGLILPNDTNDDFSKYNVNPILVKGDILSKEDLERFFSVENKGEKILIHVAGRISVFKKGDHLTTKINVEGTKNVFDLAKKYQISTAIYVSSVDALNKRKGKDKIYEQDIYDESKVDGVYSKSKAIASNYVLSLVDDNFKVMVVNPSALIGPDDPFSSPINEAIKSVINNKMPAVVKGGYDIVDVRDVANAIVHLIDKGKSKESYIISGHYITIKDLVNHAATYGNVKKVKLVLPHWLIKCVSPFIILFAKFALKKPLFTSFSLDCVLQNSNYSHDKISQLIGYHPRDIEESIKDTVNDLK